MEGWKIYASWEIKVVLTPVVLNSAAKSDATSSFPKFLNLKEKKKHQIWSLISGF